MGMESEGEGQINLHVTKSKFRMTKSVKYIWEKTLEQENMKTKASTVYASPLF